MSGRPRAALSDYAYRWGIETLFGCLKTRGFCLEATHLKDTERLKKLIALLTLAFCWAHQVGEWVVKQTSIKIKKHGRKARSIFCAGLDHLRQILLNLESCQAQFVHILSFLSCTKISYTQVNLALLSIDRLFSHKLNLEESRIQIKEHQNERKLRLW